MSHLTYEDRLTIEKELKMGSNFTQIAKKIGKNRTTVSREVSGHRHPVDARKYNDCIHRNNCTVYDRCSYKCDRHALCGTCIKCTYGCGSYQKEECWRLKYPPRVCNGCGVRCGFDRWFYHAKDAQLEYAATLKESREGISIADEDLEFLQQEVAPRIRAGCSIGVVCHELKGSMPVCGKTLYEYVNSGILDVNNLDLRRKCKRKTKKKSGPALRVDRKCHEGRSYAEFQEYMKENPEKLVSQMDTVIGKKGGSCVLSLYFTDSGVQLYYLRERNTADSVTEIFRELRERLGKDFTELFQVILTDRGSEFTDPTKIETDMETGEIQCRVFYCEPMRSNQKSECERNHELFRYISPKGKSLSDCTQEMIDEAASHINSYPRKSLGWKTPIDIFIEKHGTEILKKLGLRKVALDELQLRESLLNR